MLKSPIILVVEGFGEMITLFKLFFKGVDLSVQVTKVKNKDICLKRVILPNSHGKHPSCTS